MKVTVTIRNRQAADGESATTALAATGLLRRFGRVTTLTYMEEAEDGTRTPVTLRVDGDEVQVQRGGTAPSVLRLWQGRRCTCEYATPYGTFPIVTHARTVRDRLWEDGTLELRYTLEFGGGVTDNTLHLTVHQMEETI